MAIDWAKKLKEIPKTNENRPDGDDWFTINELRDKTGWGKDKTYRYVRKNLDSNKLETYNGNVHSTHHNQLVRRVWYRFI